MKFFINLGVKKKLILIFSVICIFMVLIGVQGISSSAKINEGSKSIYSNNLVSIKNLEGISANLNEISANMLIIAFERDKSKLNDEIQIIDALTNEDKKLQEEYESLSATTETEKIYADFKNDLLKYREVRTKVVELAKADNYDEAVKVYNSEVNPITKTMVEKLKKLIDIQEVAAKEANANNIAQFKKVTYTIVIFTAIAFLIIIFMAYILNKNIMMPLNKIKDFASRLSNYDFSDSIIITRKDEFGQTGVALNTAQENVSSLIKVIMENSQDISASSEELSATVQELSSKAETIDEAVKYYCGWYAGV
jgi:methyl-accepting chemotaxis protein